MDERKEKGETLREKWAEIFPFKIVLLLYGEQKLYIIICFL